jgi:hypothetical protein
VVLFSSGVGYFQREGTVEGNARVDLSFPVSDINDLLKSLVLQDLGGGHIAAVSYDANAPAERALQSFAVNLHGNPSFARILDQARGEPVEVVPRQANAAQHGRPVLAIPHPLHGAPPRCASSYALMRPWDPISNDLPTAAASPTSRR